MTLSRLRELPSTLRYLLAAFLMVIAFGYTLGAFFVDHTTQTRPDGIAERFRGTESMGIDPMTMPPKREIQYEKSAAEVLNITHTHVISLALVFLAVGGIFTLASGIPAWLRGFLVLEPFVSILLTFGGMWLLRYHASSWSILIAISGALMTLCLYTMTAISLWQLLRGTRQR
mgnify:CR=1 FL=1